MKICVTGAHGTIASGFIRSALSSGHSVVGLDILPPGESSSTSEITLPDKQLVQKVIEENKERYEYKQVDCLDYESFKEGVKGCDGLVHLCATFNMHDEEGNFLNARPKHLIHNNNVNMSYNALCIAAELGIDRVVIASSVNSIGMVFSKRPRFDYVPVDEDHPFYPEDPYSLSKYICEIQADSFARVYPSMRIASLRFHWVVPTLHYTPETLDEKGGSWKDLWGQVSVIKAGEAILNALTRGTETFKEGHETFFIVSKTTCQKKSSMELLKSKYPEIKDIRGEVKGNESLISSHKAEKMLGWRDEGFPWNGQ